MEGISYIIISFYRYFTHSGGLRIRGADGFWTDGAGGIIHQHFLTAHDDIAIFIFPYLIPPSCLRCCLYILSATSFTYIFTYTANLVSHYYPRNTYPRHISGDDYLFCPRRSRVIFEALIPNRPWGRQAARMHGKYSSWKVYIDEITLQISFIS